MSFFAELKRRNVFRVGIAYALMGWVALQGADFALDLVDAPNWVIQTLTIIILIGLPFALFFAWAFEVTPEGIKRESEVDRDSSITNQTGRKLDRTIIVVLVLAVAYLLVDKLILQERAAPGEPQTASAEEDDTSVAVLPFVNMSNDPDNEYFSDGLTDTLLHMLAQLPELRVAARTSSFAFKGQNIDVSEIADALGVAHILEGSVQRAGDQVRVTAQLIRADDGFHVWSQNYTRPLQDIFAFLVEIAADVADALGASLLDDGAVAIRGLETESLDAYDFYLRGLDHQADFTYTSLDLAENDFQQALIADPDFFDARMSLVRNYFLKRITGMLTNAEIQQAARPLINQITEEHPDDKLITLYDSMLEGRFNDEYKSRETVRADIYAQRERLAEVPTDTFMRVEIAGGLASVLDEPEAGLDLLATGLLIDPLSPDIYLEQGRILILMERYEEAEPAILRGIELNPDNPTGYGRLVFLAEERGDFPASLKWRREAIRRDPQDHELTFGMTEVLFGLDLLEEAEFWYERTRALAPGAGMTRALEVQRAFMRGEKEVALEGAWRAIEDEIDTRRGAHYLVAYLYTHLMMEAGREEEGYQRLLAFRPDIGDWATMPDSDRGMDLRMAAIQLYASFAPQAERLAAWRSFTDTLSASGWPWDQPGNRLPTIDAVIRGDIDAAVANQIEHRLAVPITYRTRGHQRWMPTLMGPLYDDPRMVAFATERERQRLQAKSEVETLLLSPEWSEP